MGRTLARFLQRTGRGSFALCFFTPFVTSIIMLQQSPSSTPEEDIDTQQPLIVSPACVFVMCIVIMVAITIMSQPYQNKKMPSHWQHLPINPTQVAVFTSAPCIEEDPFTAKIVRSSSHPCLSHRVKAGTTHVRSPSHNTLFNGRPPRRLCKATDHLTDEEVHRRFSAFIESRFAAMKREMPQEIGEA